MIEYRIRVENKESVAREADRECVMRRAGKLVAGLCLAALLCAGCGQEQGPATVKENALVISDKGEVTAFVVGELDRSYYDREELANMARAEADAFNERYKTGEQALVSVEQVEPLEETGKVVVTYHFDSADSYSQFMGQYEDSSLFYGTVAEAASRGYLSGAGLADVKDGTSLTEEGLKQHGERYLVITSAKASVYCPAKVTHVSKGAAMNEDNSVGTFQAEGTVYILLK